MCQSQTRLLTRVSNVALAETTEAFAFSSSLLFKKKKKCPHVSFLFGTDFGDFRL
jgi:predicted metal-binding protein